MRNDQTLHSFITALNALVGCNKHPRNGKIARLPEAARNRINRMLDDGLPYRAIIENLRHLDPADQNHSATSPLSSSASQSLISEMNLSNWYRGGYQDWLWTNRLSNTRLRLVAPPVAPG